jgi:DNA-binding MarR family transcriptional regulator/GNAT superfamily N-acetyltransferase
MDIVQQLGYLALGSRLKRASDLIMKEGALIYQANGITFDPKWFPIVYLLAQESPLGITHIAKILGYSHPAVILIVKELEANGLVETIANEADKRTKQIALTVKAMELVEKMAPVWEDIREAIHQMVKSHSNNVLLALGELEKSLRSESLSVRVQAVTKQRQLQHIEIIDYQPVYKDYFKNLNYTWINKYFTVEPPDTKVLEDPETQILKQGGLILFARYQNEIVGTCALLKEGDYSYELAKMAVDERVQGKQIGKKLGIAALEKARSIGAKEVFLLSNTRLLPAIQLYEKLGFTSVPFDGSAYKRADIKMVLNL